MQEELKRLRRLPERRLESCKRVSVGVKRSSSTIRVDGNTYSVDSRLIGEDVEVRVHADELQVWYAQGQVDTLPRLRGSRKHRIQYRHIIDWLIRKTGSVRELPLSRGVVPDDSVSDGVRPIASTLYVVAC